MRDHKRPTHITVTFKVVVILVRSSGSQRVGYAKDQARRSLALARNLPWTLLIPSVSQLWLLWAGVYDSVG